MGLHAKQPTFMVQAMAWAAPTKFGQQRQLVSRAHKTQYFLQARLHGNFGMHVSLFVRLQSCMDDLSIPTYL